MGVTERPLPHTELMIQMQLQSERSPRVAAPDRRRRFILLECPYCSEAHDALLDGGRHRTQCGRDAEALTLGGAMQGHVWGLAAEGNELRPARVIN
jgi:hypothetical protein